MLRRLLPFAVAALVAAPVALADGGSSPPGLQGGAGVLGPGGSQYVAVGSGANTVLQELRQGSAVRWRMLRQQLAPCQDRPHLIIRRVPSPRPNQPRRSANSRITVLLRRTPTMLSGVSRQTGTRA